MSHNFWTWILIYCLRRWYCFLLKKSRICIRGFQNFLYFSVIFMINTKQIKKWNCWKRCSGRVRMVFFEMRFIYLDNECRKYLEIEYSCNKKRYRNTVLKIIYHQMKIFKNLESKVRDCWKKGHNIRNLSSFKNNSYNLI